MSRRRRDNDGNERSAVRGPNSALTSFLASRGINHAALAERRARAAREAQAAEDTHSAANDDATATANPSSDAEQDEAEVEAGPSSAAGRSRATRTSKAGAKTKGKKRKRDPDASDDDDDEFNPYAKAKPIPGQIAFCAECSKKFTVTTYTKGAPTGIGDETDGLLCAPCGRKLTPQGKPATKRKSTAKRQKKSAQSQAIDNEARGPKPLSDLAMKVIAKHIVDYEGLGRFIVPQSMDRICQIVSKQRTLNNLTLRLFLETADESLCLYDCARIDTENLRSIAAMCPNLEHLDLRFCGAMTDEVLLYYAERLSKLKSIHLVGAFLVSRQAYRNFFKATAGRLTSLTISHTARFDHEVIEDLLKYHPKIASLNLSHLQRFDGECMKLCSAFSNLAEIDLSYPGSFVHKDEVSSFVSNLSSKCKVLNLSGMPSLDTFMTHYIGNSCVNLEELYLNDCDTLSDDMFRSLGDGCEAGNLHIKRLEISRAGNHVRPEKAELELPTGWSYLVNNKNLMESLTHLNINSLNGVEKGDVLSLLKNAKKLQYLDVGFLRGIDDEAVELAWNVGVTDLRVWGCNRVTETVYIPTREVKFVGRETDMTVC